MQTMTCSRQQQRQKQILFLTCLSPHPPILTFWGGDALPPAAQPLPETHRLKMMEMAMTSMVITSRKLFNEDIILMCRYDVLISGLRHPALDLLDLITYLLQMPCACLPAPSVPPHPPQGWQ